MVVIPVIGCRFVPANWTSKRNVVVIGLKNSFVHPAAYSRGKLIVFWEETSTIWFHRSLLRGGMINYVVRQNGFIRILATRKVA
eukprot:467308-Rhodomonas_salina.2